MKSLVRLNVHKKVAAVGLNAKFENIMTLN